MSGLHLENIGPAAMLILVGAAFIAVAFLVPNVSIWLAVIGFLFVLIGAVLAGIQGRG